MRRSRLWMISALMLALVAMLGISACGDDEDGGDDGTTAESTTGGETAAEDLGLLSDGTLTVASDIPYPPFEFGDPPDYEGFDIDLINAVADEMGLETEIVRTPFNAILAGGAGRFDLAVAATTIDDDREEAVDFSDPYFEAEQSLLVRADSGITSLDELTPDQVIAAQDDTTGERYASQNSDAELRPFPVITDAYNALASGQVDAVLNDVPSTSSAAADNPDLEVVETYSTGELYGIVFPQDSDALREAVNQALVTIKEDGTLDELYQEWFDTSAPEALLDATHEPS